MIEVEFEIRGKVNEFEDNTEECLTNWFNNDEYLSEGNAEVQSLAVNGHDFTMRIKTNISDSVSEPISDIREWFSNDEYLGQSSEIIFEKMPMFPSVNSFIDWTDTKEGFTMFEKSIDEFVNGYIKKYGFYDKVCEKIHNLPFETKKSLVDKINAKYESDSYINRWHNKKNRPSEPDYFLRWVAYEYAEKYGKDYKDGYTGFVSSCKIVDDYFIIERLDGQGSYIKLMTLEDGKKEIERCKRIDNDYKIIRNG